MQMTWSKSASADRLEGLYELAFFLKELLSDQCVLPPKKFELVTLGFVYLALGDFLSVEIDC
jgi:hypothetical protein